MNTTLEQMSNHLGFLGFTVESKKEQEGRQRNFLLASHPVSYNISVMELGPDIFLFKANILSENTPGQDMDVAINAANRALAVSRIYYDVEEEKVVYRIEATYLGKYDKETFASFMSHVERDHRCLPLVEEFKKAFMDPRKKFRSTVAVKTPYS